MIEKPKRPKQPNIQDRQPPRTLQELINRYDLDNTKIYDFLDELVELLNTERKSIDTSINDLNSDIDNMNNKKVNKSGDTMTGVLTLKKTSYNYNGGAIPGTKLAQATTVTDLINELRYTNGQIGSVNIKTTYTLNNITISTGWYNYSYIPHRIGGIDGGANSDSTNFGTLMLAPMTLSSPIYVLRYNSEVIRELTSLATTNVTKDLQTQINNRARKVKLNWGTSMTFELSNSEHALVMVSNIDCLMLWAAGSPTTLNATRIYGNQVQASYSRISDNKINVTVKYTDNRGFTGTAIIA